MECTLDVDSHRKVDYTDENGTPHRIGRPLDHVQRGESVYERYVSAGFVTRLAISYFVLLIIGFGFAGFVYAVDLDKLIDPNVFSSLLAPITLFIGLPFVTLVSISFNTYTVPIDQFVRLGHRIQHTATMIFSSIKGAPSHALSSAVLDCEAILHVMCYYNFRLFNSSAPERLRSGIFPPRANDPNANLHLANELVVGRNARFASETMEQLISMLNFRLRQLESVNHISSSDYAVIHQCVARIEQSLEDIRCSHVVSTPQLFRDFIYLSLGIYILAFIPISLCVTNRPNLWVVPFGYAFIAFSVVGFVIFKDFVGEPFDDSRKVATVDYRGLVVGWQSTIKTRRVHSVRQIFGMPSADALSQLPPPSGGLAAARLY